MQKDIDYKKFWSPAFDTMDDFIFLIDADFKIIKVNKSFLSFTKQEKEDFFIGKRCFEVMHGTGDPIDKCPHKETLETGKYSAGELYEPGIKAWLYVKTTPIYEEGALVGSIHIATDITERKKAEDELRKKMHALEVFQKSAVDRELKMLELKKRIETLEAKLKEKQ